jgi:hypothetical protein
MCAAPFNPDKQAKLEWEATCWNDDSVERDIMKLLRLAIVVFKISEFKMLLKGIGPVHMIDRYMRQYIINAKRNDADIPKLDGRLDVESTSLHNLSVISSFNLPRWYIAFPFQL